MTTQTKPDPVLPPLPTGLPTYEFPDGAYSGEDMQDYGRACYAQARAALAAAKGEKQWMSVKSLKNGCVTTIRPHRQRGRMMDTSEWHGTGRCMRLTHPFRCYGMRGKPAP